MAVTEQEQNKAVLQKPKKSFAFVEALIGLCFLLPGGSLLYYGAIGSAGARVQSADYHRAPGCTPNGAASSGLSPCQFQTMTLTSKNRINGGDGPDTHKLGLGQSGKPAQEVTLSVLAETDLFAHASVGEAVQVKSWKGKILVVAIPGWHCDTQDHPDVQVCSSNNALFVGGFFMLIGVLTSPYSRRADKNQDCVIEGTS